MADEEQTQVARLADGMYRVDPELSQRLIALGFDPVALVYISTNGFTQEAITRALFMSRRHEPEVVQFNIEVRDAEDCVLPMEIELLRTLFVTDLNRETGEPDPWNDPRWYLRGHLGRCSLNPNGEVIRMHAYITDLIEGDRYAEIQIVRETPVRNPAISLDGQLVQDLKGYPRIANRLSR